MHIKFSLKPSYYLLSILCLASVLTNLVIACMPLLLWLKALLILTVIFSSIFYIARDALGLLPCSWVVLEIDSQPQFQLTARNGMQHIVTVLPESLVANYLIVLQLKVEQRFLRKSLILLADSAGHDDLRRLRVWLKWASHKSNDDSAASENAA